MSGNHRGCSWKRKEEEGERERGREGRRKFKEISGGVGSECSGVIARQGGQWRRR